MKTITRALAVLLLAVGLSVAVVQPAQASASSCPSGAVCYWDDSNWNVLLQSIPGLPGHCYNVLYNDRANGFYNRLSKHVQMYKDANCTGPLLRNWSGSTGPFPPGHLSLFYKAVLCGDCDQNKLTSIFVNTG